MSTHFVSYYMKKSSLESVLVTNIMSFPQVSSFCSSQERLVGDILVEESEIRV